MISAANTAAIRALEDEDEVAVVGAHGMRLFRHLYLRRNLQITQVFAELSNNQTKGDHL
jgi:hypothetical protein